MHGGIKLNQTSLYFRFRGPDSCDLPQIFEKRAVGLLIPFDPLRFSQTQRILSRALLCPSSGQGRKEAALCSPLKE